jgi:hypothetical protein
VSDGKPSVRLEHVLLAIVVALWVVTLGILLIPETSGALGTAHPDFVGMRHGGSGLERHAAVLWAGWAFGGVGIVLYAALMAFGTRRGPARQAIAPWLVLGLCAFLATWTGLVLAYRTYMLEGPGRLFLGFPLPTAIMLYVLFPASLIFTVTYVVGFGRWVFSEDDETAYERLLAETQEPRSRSTAEEPGKAGPGSG